MTLRSAGVRWPWVSRRRLERAERQLEMVSRAWLREWRARRANSREVPRS